MHRSEVISRLTPSPAQNHVSPPHGTKVSVRDLFGAMPVRVKQRAITAEKQGGNLKDWEELKCEIVLLLLSWNGNVSVTLRDNGTHQKMLLRAPRQSLDMPHTMDETFLCSILTQANLIKSNEKDSWVSIDASTPKLTLSGIISLDPSATKSVQFVSFGIHPVIPLDGQGIFHDEINRLFSNSNFGNEEEAEELDEGERKRRANDARFKSDGYTNRELKSGRKGVDRWPKFYIRIQPKVSEGLAVRDILDQRGSRLSLVLELLQAMIQAFLTRYQFRPKGICRQLSPRKSKHVAKPIQNSLEVQADSEIASPPQPLRSCLKPPRLAPPLDLFGTNVKYPSFLSAASQVENSLESWSRIKSGTPNVHLNSPDLQTDLSFSPASIRRPSTAPPPYCTLSTSLTERYPPSTTLSTPPTPLLSKEGKLVRRPFDDVVDSMKPESLPSRRISQKSVVISNQNDTVLWVNPITKTRSFVNTRTGHTMAENRAASTPPDLGSQLTSQKRLTCRFVSNRNPENVGPTSQWLTNILKTWENPIFQPTELAIPQISFDGAGDQTRDLFHGRNHHCSQIDIDRAFKECSSGLNGRVSKEGLRNAKVISQVDSKFILVRINCINKPSDSGSEMLVIVDQHAADERIRIESLMAELCSPSKTFDSGIEATTLDKPISFEVPMDEVNLLQSYRAHFADWGILYNLPIRNPKTEDSHTATKSTTMSRVVVRSLPSLVQERCKQEPRLLIQLIRTELWKVHESRKLPVITSPRKTSQPMDWLEKLHSCPQGIIDMLNSRACRSAIMFNDILTRAQCEILLRKLSDCKFPFQCAHGRPSLVPLVDLAHLPRFSFDDEAIRDGQTFGSTFNKWKQTL